MPNISNLKSVAIASLHFAPVHATHMIAHAKALTSLGFDVTFILHPRYLEFENFSPYGRIVLSADAGDWLEREIPGLALLANAAVGNVALAFRMRQRGTRVWYLFHEPIALREHLDEGCKDLAKLAVAKITSIVTACLSERILVPSRFALGSYRKHFNLFNSNASVMELLFDDEARELLAQAAPDERMYFSFLGYASEAHDFPCFIEFAKWADRKGANIRFAVATRSDISEILRQDSELRDLQRRGVVEILQGRVLSQHEMQERFLRSFCVWNVYRNCTQSGVLPRAFMSGTPVLGADRGSLADYIQPGKTGELVDDGRDFPAILDALGRIKASLPSYSRHCRNAFLERFHWNSAVLTYRALLEPSSEPRLHVESCIRTA
jgi:glycosyltransferase involved in cell wall biosynthesis